MTAKQKQSHRQNKTVLVLGATGKTGQPVVEQALQAGLKVRAVIRREDDRSEKLREAGATTVFGDVHDIKSVRHLVQDVDAIYFAYPPQLDRLVEATANIAVAAKGAGVKTVVNMSQLTVRENARSPLTHHHWLSEQVFDHADIGAIHIRPSFFAENLVLFAAQTIAAEGKIYLPYGSRSHAPVTAHDIARVVVHLLQHPEGNVGARHVLTGPDNLTVHEMANVIGQEIGSPVAYVDIPAEQWETILVEQVGLPPFLAEHLKKVAIDHQEGVFDQQTDTVETLTGSPPQSLRDFVKKALPLFQGNEAVFLGV
jgi:NAD(P)H dehydrogenase (quinone)